MSADQLLKDAGELSLSELDRLVAKIINLRAQRAAPSVPASEAELLLKINRGLPAPIQSRAQELTAKRDTKTLTPSEHEELKRLSLQAEEMEAERIQHLTQLARLRHSTLAELMNRLGLHGSRHV